MGISNVSVNNTQLYNYNNKVQNAPAQKSDINTQAAKTEQSASAEVVGAEYVKSEDIKTNTYNRQAALDYINAAQEARMSSFRSMVSRLLDNQDIKFNTTTLPDMKDILSSEDIEKAQRAIEEGGEYSVGAVSSRIMDMAKVLAAGDDTNIDVLRKAVQKGFEDAQKIWGEDEMPEITKKTYDAVMKAFDEWEQEAQAPKENADSQQTVQQPENMDVTGSSLQNS